jgi:hypothetical protein
MCSFAGMAKILTKSHSFLCMGTGNLSPGVWPGLNIDPKVPSRGKDEIDSLNLEFKECIIQVLI